MSDHTNLTAGLSHLLHRHFLWLLVAAYAAAALLPGPGLSLKNLTLLEVPFLGERTRITLPMLSLALVLLTTLMSPLTTPAVLHAASWLTTGEYAGELRGLAAGGTSIFLLACVALPSLLGIVGRHLVGGDRIDGARPQFKLVNY